MNPRHHQLIAKELDIALGQVERTSTLIDEGATVPFISRYRKEITGSLDEVAVAAIRDRLEQLLELDKRREVILKSLEENGHLTAELNDAVNAAESLTRLEDIYLPYRPKRRTRATIARERGLEPLAESLFAMKGIDPLTEAAAFVDPEKEIANVDDALAGARDIVAEWISEDPKIRERLRALYLKSGVIRSKLVSGKEAEGAKFRDYFEWEEPIGRTPSHRVLAMRRGEKEGILALRIEPPETDAIAVLSSLVLKGTGPDVDQVREATEDSYSRLLSNALETEMRTITKERADEEAIRVFSENIRELLLAAPLGRKRVMAIDPGFRTGCKLVCLDEQGKLLHTETIYPRQGAGKDAEAKTRLVACFTDFKIEAIGNGTGGRELEAFIRALRLQGEPLIVMVNESGASVYSASTVARQEFPDHDLTVRGAVSIGRRLTDPLAELVKIDPKSIGVGQYQHDVDQGALKHKLDDVVMSCVNGVGVELNTASQQLLTYVSGLGPTLASNIIERRDTLGPFTSRKELLGVPRMGPKAFEQCAGFLRIHSAHNPLDSSAVHPERYPVVEAIASSLGATVGDLIADENRLSRIDLNAFVSDDVGLPTLRDIVDELRRPGRDPRQQFEAFSFTEGVDKIQDLEAGMTLPGIVTNVTAFGAFVDVGVHQDGLVHISQLADKFVKNPADIVKVQQQVRVTVLAVDLTRNRIALSMKRHQNSAEGSISR